MRELLMAHLHRIERDPAGLPIRLFPFARTGTGEREAPVQIDPTIAFGRPSLRGRAVPTAVLADRFKAGHGVVWFAWMLRSKERGVVGRKAPFTERIAPFSGFAATSIP